MRPLLLRGNQHAPQPDEGKEDQYTNQQQEEPLRIVPCHRRIFHRNTDEMNCQCAHLLQMGSLLRQTLRVTWVRVERVQPVGHVIHAWLVPRTGSRARCSVCGKKRPAYDTRPERRWRYVRLWGIRVLLHYRPRQADSSAAGRCLGNAVELRQESAESAIGGSLGATGAVVTLGGSKPDAE